MAVTSVCSMWMEVGLAPADVGGGGPPGILGQVLADVAGGGGPLGIAEGELLLPWPRVAAA